MINHNTLSLSGIDIMFYASSFLCIIFFLFVFFCLLRARLFHTNVNQAWKEHINNIPKSSSDNFWELMNEHGKRTEMFINAYRDYQNTTFTLPTRKRVLSFYE